MADINVLDLTPTTPGSNDSLILFDRTTGEGKSTRFDTLSDQVLDSKFGDSNPTAGQELSYDATTGKYKNTSQIASLSEALTNEVETRTELGAHNLLNLSLAEIKSLNTSGTWNGNAYTFRGVTFTINNDLSISTSGTVNTGNLAFYLKNSIPLKNGTYKVIGCPSGATSYELLAMIGSTEYKDRGNGAEFTISNNTVSISIYTRLNEDMSGLTFKPQIILATDPSTEYTPYAMTNRELTDLYIHKIVEAASGDSVTVPANSYYIGTLSYPNVDGYTAILPMLKASGSVRVLLQGLSLNTNLGVINYTLLNTSAADQTAVPAFYLVYKKNV